MFTILIIVFLEAQIDFSCMFFFSKKSGFLVEKSNDEQLIEKLRLLFEDVDMAKKMGNKGRKFIEETFNWELITKNFIKIAKSYLK